MTSTDGPATVRDGGEESATVWDRMLRAGVSEQRARAHLAAGRLRVDGVEVRDPNHPAPRPARYVIAGS